jgi:hypothetical protein
MHESPAYYQINLRERRIIERLYAEGYNPGKIARQIFRSRSTVYREIERNGYPGEDGKWHYMAKRAQMFCSGRKQRSKRRSRIPIGRERTSNDFYVRGLRWPFFRNKPEPYRKGPGRWERRPYPLSRWHRWQVRSWRESYNRRRSRHHKWEEFWRRKLKRWYKPLIPVRDLRHSYWFFNRKINKWKYRRRFSKGKGNNLSFLYKDRHYRKYDRPSKFRFPFSDPLPAPPEYERASKFRPSLRDSLAVRPKIADNFYSLTPSPQVVQKLAGEKYAQKPLIRRIFQKIPQFSYLEVHGFSVNAPIFS